MKIEQGIMNLFPPTSYQGYAAEQRYLIGKVISTPERSLITEMTLISDEQLALGIQRGRSEDLTGLIERHHAALLGFLYCLTGGDRLLAEDLVQETFLRMLTRIVTYHYPSPVKPWLYAIAINLARDHYKQAEYRHTDSLPARLDPPAAGTPESELVAVEEAQGVQELMSLLPASQREAILLRYIEELSLKEIAQVLQVPVGTVKSRLSLGLLRLKQVAKRK